MPQSLAKNSVSKGALSKGPLAMVRLAKCVEKIPRLLSIKRYVDEGDKLCLQETDFLKRLFADARALHPLTQHYPQYRTPMETIKQLYWDVVDQAIINENNEQYRGELSWI